jgi:hypothetical protein
MAPDWMHAALSVVIPSAIGGLMYAGFELWDRLRRRRRGGKGLPLVDYSI